MIRYSLSFDQIDPLVLQISLVAYPSLFLYYALDFRYPKAGCLLLFCLAMAQIARTKMKKRKKRSAKGQWSPYRLSYGKLTCCLGDICRSRLRPRSFFLQPMSWLSCIRWRAPLACPALPLSSLPSTTPTNAHSRPLPERENGQAEHSIHVKETFYLQTLKNQWKRSSRILKNWRK